MGGGCGARLFHDSWNRPRGEQHGVRLDHRMICLRNDLRPIACDLTFCLDLYLASQAYFLPGWNHKSPIRSRTSSGFAIFYPRYLLDRRGRFCRTFTYSSVAALFTSQLVQNITISENILSTYLWSRHMRSVFRPSKRG